MFVVWMALGAFLTLVALATGNVAVILAAVVVIWLAIWAALLKEALS